MRPDFCFGDRLSGFFSPNKILLGIGASRKVGPEVKAFGGNKAIAVTDKGVVNSGALEGIKGSLAAEGIETVVYDGAAFETPARVIGECAQFARDEGCDVVIGLGGGTSLDTAKGVSLLAVNGGSVLEYEGMDRVPLKGLPKIMVPTTAGSGSEVTRVFAVTDEADRTKKVVYTSYNLADAVILDPSLTLTLPPSLTAETGLDALAHAVEAYTSRNGTPFSDMLALEAIRLVGKSLFSAYEKGDDLETRYHMLLAATLAGLSFSSGGLGAIHALSFELETLHGISHARGVAILLPHVMAYNLPSAAGKFASIAAALGEEVHGLSDDEGAEKALDSVRLLLKKLKISSRLGDYGITAEHVEKMAEGAARQERLFGNNARDVGPADIKGIYRSGLG